MLAKKSSLPNKSATGINFEVLDICIAVLQISTKLIKEKADSIPTIKPTLLLLLIYSFK